MKTTPSLIDAERQPCEIWTRVMGYHRPVSQFNAGKRSEQAERRSFRETAVPAQDPPRRAAA
jgi:hypothetical protein